MSPLIALILFVLGLAATAAAVDVIVESAKTGAAELTIFGNALWEPPSARIGILILAGLGFLVGIILAFILAAWRDRRLVRWFERERRNNYVHEAGVQARTRLLEQRSEFLLDKVDQLTELRTRLVGENDELRREADELDARIVKAKRRVEQQEKVIVLPDLAEQSRAAGHDPGAVENERGG